MLDARVHLPSRGFLFAAVLLTATRVGAQPPPDTTKKAATQIMGAAAKQAAAAVIAAQQQAVAVVQPAVRQWSAPKPCGGNPTYSRGRPGAPPSVPILVGSTIAAARNALAQYRVFVDSRFVPGTGRPDSIISHAPIAGTPVAPGDTVIVCSYFPTRIPSVMGQSASNAQQTLKDSGYNSVVVTTPVPPTTAMGVVLQQSPRARTVAPLGSVDTLYIGVPAAPPTRPMPNLDSATYGQADNALRALNAFTNNQLLITWRSASGGSYTTPGSIVVAQRPSAGTPVKAGDAILVVLRDTTSPPPPPPPTTTQLPPPTTTQVPPPTTTVPMPNLQGRPMSSAMAALQRLRRRVPFTFRRGLVPSRKLPFDSTRALVDSQSPAPNAPLSAQSVAVLIFRDTTATPPPPTQVIMPNVVSRTVKFARDTLFILGIPFRATATDNDDNAGDAWIIQRQSVPAGATIIATTTVRLYATNPATSRPWPWIAAGVAALLLAAAATVYAKTGQQRVARMAVVPHADPIPPRVQLRMRGGETADEAFSRIGLSIKPVADRGMPKVTSLTLTSSLHRDRHG